MRSQSCLDNLRCLRCLQHAFAQQDRCQSADRCLYRRSFYQRVRSTPGFLHQLAHTEQSRVGLLQDILCVDQVKEGIRARLVQPGIHRCR